MGIKVVKEGLLTDTGLLPLYSGSVHYWRQDRSLWRDTLMNIKKMGFGIVETYIPWSVHEISRGVFDFGSVDAGKDIDAFLSLCEELELYVHVRPGPHINSEMTYFGYPKRIVLDPSMQARSPFGTPVNLPHSPKVIPVPSYASERFYEEVSLYFHALSPIIKKHAYPDGNIIAIQSDNETCYFFRERPYVSDYHPDSIALYRQMLEKKYLNIETLNTVYRSSYHSFEELDPPTGFRGTKKEDLPFYLDWAEYKEYQICWCLRRFADMWRSYGISLPFYQNTGYHYYTPSDNIRIEQNSVDICGIDMYPNCTSTKSMREKIRYMSGSSILPFVPEYGSGVWYEFPRTFLPWEEEFTTGYAFMNGLKAINFYMLVERDRWQGSPIKNNNSIRPEYFNFYRKFLDFLHQNKIWKFFRRPRVLVLKNYDCARLKSVLSTFDLAPLDVNTFAPGFRLPPNLFSVGNIFGFRHFDTDSDHWATEHWFENTVQLLLDADVDYNVSDTHQSLEKLVQYDYVFSPTYDFMSEDVQTLLRDYAMTGKNLIIGPGIPHLNMEMFPCSILQSVLPLPNVKIAEHITAQFLDDLEIPVPFRTDAEGIEINCHYDEHRLFLWIANVTEQKQDFSVTYTGFKKFIPKYNSHYMEGTSEIALLLSPYSVSVWEVQS